MKVGFIHCQLKGCKNITKNIYKEEYGAYCFLHTKYVNTFDFDLSDTSNSKSRSAFSISSPVSSRRTPISPTREFTVFDDSEETPLRTVSSSKYKVPSPKSKSVYIPKTECGICKDLYEQTNVMKCGHLICENDLKELRSPYCPFCGQYMEGPFVSEEIMQIIEDKYKQDIREEGIKYEDDEEE
jgi:hypothetical protein